MIQKPQKQNIHTNTIFIMKDKIEGWMNGLQEIELK